jgi:ribonuclease P protein component
MTARNFPKQERLTSNKLEEQLFSDKQRRSATAFPLRAVWLLREMDTQDKRSTACVQVVVTAPKKRLHHAVDRNRAKRQMREAWRLNSQPLKDDVPAGQQLLVALVWTASTPRPTTEVFLKAIQLMERIAKDIRKRAATDDEDANDVAVGQQQEHTP